MIIRFFVKASIFAGFIILSYAATGADLSKRQSELKSIQTQINAQQNDLKNTSKQREKLITLLKKDEQAIARAASRVNETQTSLKNISSQLIDLEKQQKSLTAQKIGQQKTLSKQLSSAYLAGNHDYSKMMLNQQNPATIERMLAYYQYLNNARIKAISKLKTTSEQLVEVQNKQVKKQQQLNTVMIDQKQQAKQLSNEQNQRQQTLTQIQRTLSNKGAQLEQLQIEEASLKRIVEQAVVTAKANPLMDGLENRKGKLSWPTKGRMSERFGSNRSGQIKWKGAVLTAPEGQNIKAVAAGKVIYADWLRGFGMVMVLDHGKGYMSLYGHAQTLFKEAGDNVNDGESIALVGRSGGQTEPSLYFEIRHKGQAVDPARYCR
ncbi:murein hydrolase activator EnvC family protein [Shewanella glacialimarina]|uniref:murein hydrolase activator EnvC family protein n=1 Tax=Shewanella glacialimarina TaxID=2590884 RepID=UPI001CF91EEC|nr:peptidoglycan DD-metalloendopeptidase family protein [Shewanella glacialimarina]UCX06453.1 peptidoglycan DD-metalloendopeptidase family protein [Shewanella glacialimarina]